MAKESLSIPKGTRDFGPEQMSGRNYIFQTLRNVFELHGFRPIETPSMEQLSTLLGKYGDEGDKLLFRILNSGDYLKNVNDDLLQERNIDKIAGLACEKGLRYDLTVPFARFVVMHRNDITFPFRRYQMQAVWRADRPQRGRYREFFQCDVDVIGTNSLLEECALIRIIDEVFRRLKLRVSIKLNNRKVLQGIADVIGINDNFVAFTVAIDKIDKIGWDGVKSELINNGIPSVQCDKLQTILSLQDNPQKLIEHLRPQFADSPTGLLGLDELSCLFDYLSEFIIDCPVEFDLSLARGLNYYTGAIFEVKALDVQIGSICGGGRYDNLTGIFGMPGVSGVGISFGADRIYDVIQELNLFPSQATESTHVLIANFGGAEEKWALKILEKLQQAGIATEIYPENGKLKKQFAYANDRKIPIVIIAGSDEMNAGIVNIRNMKSGDQQAVKIDNIIASLQS